MPITVEKAELYHIFGNDDKCNKCNKDINDIEIPLVKKGYFIRKGLFVNGNHKFCSAP